MRRSSARLQRFWALPQVVGWPTRKAKWSSTTANRACLAFMLARHLRADLGRGQGRGLAQAGGGGHVVRVDDGGERLEGLDGGGGLHGHSLPGIARFV